MGSSRRPFWSMRPRSISLRTERRQSLRICIRENDLWPKNHRHLLLYREGLVLWKNSWRYTAHPNSPCTEILQLIFEVVTWSQLGIHSYPIILLNVNGFYTPILDWINKAVESGFIKPGNANIVVEAKSVDEIPEKLGGYRLSDARYRLDWTVQSPLESHKVMSNGTT
jgi:Possible lysine decarboxylase